MCQANYSVFQQEDGINSQLNKLKRNQGLVFTEPFLCAEWSVKIWCAQLIHLHSDSVSPIVSP